MPPLPRRPMLAGAAAMTLAGPAPEPTLRQAGRRAGLRIGTSSEIDLTTSKNYATLIGRQCDLFAPNMSWQRMSPAPDAALVDLDPNVEAARRAGLRLTGYHLLWHQRLPRWFAGLDRAGAERAIRAHVATMGARFGPQTFSWNVINEAIRPADQASGGLRRSPLLDKFGTLVFDIAYAAARDAAPGALRVYNDYDFELATANDAARRGALLGLLDELARRAVPIQAVGLQCHLRSASFDRFDRVLYAHFLEELAARGLDIFITELDVQDGLTGTVGARDDAVAEIYRRFLDVALAQKRVRVLAFWGLGDRYSWLNDPARPNSRRADGELGRSLLFDAALQPKQAFAAVGAAMARRAQWKK